MNRPSRVVVVDDDSPAEVIAEAQARLDGQLGPGQVAIVTETEWTAMAARRAALDAALASLPTDIPERLRIAVSQALAPLDSGPRVVFPEPPAGMNRAQRRAWRRQ